MFERLHDAAPNGVSVAAMSRGIARAHTHIDGESDATPASLQLVSSNFFEALHVSPVLGRTLSSPANALLADPMQPSSATATGVGASAHLPR
jgi:hypothetical protein